MNPKARLAVFVSLLLMAALRPAPAIADTWMLPTQTQYYSPDKSFYLDVTPKRLESQLKYFEDQVSGKENAGAAEDEQATQARGALYARGSDGKYSRKSEFPLLNKVAPADALVSDRGDYFVTFDNWHNVGYGDQVVVIYRADGSVVRKLSLSDFLTEADIEKLSRTVSSIWWREDAFIDEAKRELVLPIRMRQEDPHQQMTPARPKVRIDLATGQLLRPKRDLHAHR
ncbi:MAG TPA: hypothetical protein VN493_09240 [Thermoanaerobaculia bacterium]|nr:hypothetical protein [Thermoanaerobaculia bacterium]